MSNWEKYERAELEAMWQTEVDAGDTRLTYNEWAARFIMEQSKKAAPVDKVIPKSKPVDNKEIPSGKAKQKAEPQTALPDLGTPQATGGKADKNSSASQPLPKVDMSIKALEERLTDKQKMFCREYIIDYNGTRAAIAAGYSKASARKTGSENVTKPDIQAYLAALQKPKLEKLDIEADWILSQYKAMAAANIGHYMAQDEDGRIKTIDGMPYPDMEGMHVDDLFGLAGFETIIMPKFDDDSPNPLKIKLKLADKKAALDVLAKRAGLLKEHIEHSGAVNVAVDDNELAMRVAFLLRKAQENMKKEKQNA